jgi:hypothetical protein
VNEIAEDVFECLFLKQVNNGIKLLVCRIGAAYPLQFIIPMGGCNGYRGGDFGFLSVKECSDIYGVKSLFVGYGL